MPGVPSRGFARSGGSVAKTSTAHVRRVTTSVLGAMASTPVPDA